MNGRFRADRRLLRRRYNVPMEPNRARHIGDIIRERSYRRDPRTSWLARIIGVIVTTSALILDALATDES